MIFRPTSNIGWVDMEKPKSSARQRQLARQSRQSRQPMAVRNSDAHPQKPFTGISLNILQKTECKHPTAIKFVGLALIVLILLIVVLNIFFSNRLPPNVFILDNAVGGMPLDEAISLLESTWAQDRTMTLSSETQECRMPGREEGTARGSSNLVRQGSQEARTSHPCAPLDRTSSRNRVQAYH